MDSVRRKCGSRRISIYTHLVLGAKEDLADVRVGGSACQALYLQTRISGYHE